jgi:hypothetical protein
VSETPVGDTESRPERLISLRWARVLYAGAAVAALGALIVNITRPFGWQVDATSVGLIGVLLLIPIAEQLRKLKFGGIEAEFEDRLKRDIGNLEKRVKDIGDRASEPIPADQAELEPAPSTVPPGRSIRRIVWVDDRPEGNRLEMAELRERFNVVSATSTEAGMDAISSSPEDTAVISDAVREEDGRQNVAAGKQLIARVAKEHPGIPVYIYCGSETAQRYGTELYQAGARFVTDSFTDLHRTIRSDAGRRFESEVKRILQAAGNLEQPEATGIDYVVEVSGHRIGVVAKNYRRSAAAHHAEAINRAVGRLTNLVDKGDIASGLFVTPRDVFSQAQRQQLPKVVLLLSIDELPETLLNVRGAAQS